MYIIYRAMPWAARFDFWLLYTNPLEVVTLAAGEGGLRWSPHAPQQWMRRDHSEDQDWGQGFLGGAWFLRVCWSTCGAESAAWSWDLCPTFQRIIGSSRRVPSGEQRSPSIWEEALLVPHPGSQCTRWPSSLPALIPKIDNSNSIPDSILWNWKLTEIWYTFFEIWMDCWGP